MRKWNAWVLAVVVAVLMAFGSGTARAAETQTHSVSSVIWPGVWGTWVCNARYVGPFGWGYYYGYATTQAQAIWNAQYVCGSNHFGHVAGCLVTNCYLRW